MDMVTPRIEVLEDGATHGKFVVEPLEQGFGYTIGNALRRVLLSSIPGAAVTSIKIDGVLHEFSTIPGVKEDTTELLLNLRELFVKVNSNGSASEESTYTINIDVHGPGEVTGADIQTPPEVEIVNPEIRLATLNDETATLRAELTVEKGKGYVLPDKHEKNKQSSIGVISIGAVYTPVRKVSYIVEPTRVGHKSDYDRLIIDVVTNGTVRPSDAVSEAAKIIDRHLRLFFDFVRKSGSDVEEFGDGIGGSAPMAPDVRIEELDFSQRTQNCLRKINILTVKDLVQLSELDLMSIRNFGRKSLNEVREKLEALNISLKPSGDRSSSNRFSDVDMDDDYSENENENISNDDLENSSEDIEDSENINVSEDEEE
ncbi:MAG: DNA-directed RNA polymerase subunit alpha [Armatimonadota bacterium]